MKVEVLVTIRCTPESRGEMIDSFGASYRAYREQTEELQKAGQLAIPPETPIRWLLSSGRWE